MTQLDDSLVLITGAPGGFGRQLVRQFLDAGSQLIVCAHDDAGLKLLTADFPAEAARIQSAIVADLSSAEGCQQLFDEVESSGLGPDILINNAGIAVSGRHDLVPVDRWETLMQTNLLAPMRLCGLFTPMMIKRRSGHIVNISSLAGWIGGKGTTAYSASKFGLRGFSESLAEDLAGLGVKVSAVYPFFSRTPILDSEQFGVKKRTEIPDRLVTDPADVVAEILQGIKSDRRHIFPDKMSRRLHYIQRFSPWMIKSLKRRFAVRENSNS